MVSMAAPTTSAYCGYYYKTRSKNFNGLIRPRVILSQQQNDNDNNNKPSDQIARREIILRSSEIAVVGAIFNLSGKKPEYLGVQKNQQALALCPATKNCISTSENISDLTHYTPPWNYNGNRKKPVNKEVAMKELLQVIQSTKPDKFTPRVAEKSDDYVHVEYQSPILGLVDDVEFWFPPGNNSTVEYRSASRLGNFDFDYNRKRIKTLREELEKKGWASADSF
ncbi:uncharacterized protein LOC8270642 [Ricinus communis]|uniref:DUF1499 domain-containing protein n=1 Tax=Ricinus communis TaxID=3988 RepID=B9RDD4_RICCO|nr:uncharacterized protein LOC8270642 [Ricinus communis]EEF50391.1 conserved hypothetical protein [Ricinus communis]|eukprot:XP_002511722.1 uncharacterized protein LOC8270642 [Ricinus communis]